MRGLALLALVLCCGCEALWGGFRAPHVADLSAVAGEDGGDGGAAADLGPCAAARCPGGCCNGGRCEEAPVFPRCGRSGNTCVVCDNRADRCDARGGCSCGGIDPACAAGQRCQNARCLCGPASCPSGCCKDDRCTQPAFPTCQGDDGGVCEVCDNKADRCFNGRCSCGGRGFPCRTPGDVCSFGDCI